MLCLHPLDTAKRLKHQIDMSGKTYKDLVVTLYEGKKDFGNAINFYMAAARDFLGEPLLLIVPQHCTDKTNPTLKYEFQKMYAFKEDSYLAESEIKLRFVFNGIDYYAPFFQTSIAQIIRVGTPLLKSIKQNFKDLESIEDKLPQQVSINTGVTLLKSFMKTASDIAHKMSFNAGACTITDQEADRFANTTPVSHVRPLLSSNVRRRKSDTTECETPVKKPKELVSLAAHLSEMDKDTVHAIPALTRIPDNTSTVTGNTSTGTDSLTTSATSSDTLATSVTADTSTATTSSQVTTTSTVSPSKPTDCKPCQCVCGIEYADFESLKYHKGVVHKNNTFQCSGYFRKGTSTERCIYVTRDEGTIWRHYRTIHLGLFYHYCDQKDCKTGWRGNKYGNDSKTAVEKHKSEVHKIANVGLKCPTCAYVAPEKYKLTRHMSACQNKDKSVKWLKCPDPNCTKGYRDHDSFQRHKRQQHPEIPGDKSAFYHCSLCPKYFSTFGGRKKHEAKHVEEEQKKAEEEAKKYAMEESKKKKNK